MVEFLPRDGGASKRRWRVLSFPLVLRLFSNLISFDGQHDNSRFTGEQLAIMLVEIAFAFLGALSSARLHSRFPVAVPHSERHGMQIVKWCLSCISMSISVSACGMKLHPQTAAHITILGRLMFSMLLLIR
jgi:hypothetical protein